MAQSNPQSKTEIVPPALPLFTPQLWHILTRHDLGDNISFDNKFLQQQVGMVAYYQLNQIVVVKVSSSSLSATTIQTCQQSLKQLPHPRSVFRVKKSEKISTSSIYAIIEQKFSKTAPLLLLLFLLLLYIYNYFPVESNLTVTRLPYLGMVDLSCSLVKPAGRSWSGESVRQ